MSSFSMVSLNCLSLCSRARQEALEGFMSAINSKVFLLQETKLCPGRNFFINNYNIFRTDRLSGAGGGTAIVIKAEITVRNLKHFRDYIEATSIEMVLNGVWTQVVSCYIPPQLAPNDRASVAFSKFLNNQNCLIGGDFNAKNRVFGDDFDNSIGNWLTNFSFTNNLNIINPNSPTCFYAVNGTYIDKFLSRNVISDSVCISLPSFSDHHAIQTISTFSSDSCGQPLHTIRAYSWTKVGLLNKFINEKLDSLRIPVDTNLSVNAVNQLFSLIHNIFNDAVAKFVPVRQVNFTKVTLSYNTLTLRSQQRNLLRKYKRNVLGFQRAHILHAIRTDIKLINIMLINSIKFDITNYFRNVLVDIKDMNALHCSVRAGRSSGGLRNVSSLLREDGTLVSGENDVLRQCAFNPLFFTPGEVKDTINSRSNRTSVGTDNMPYRLLKLLDDRIITRVVVLFNHLVANGFFPDCWKNSIVVPIPKPGKNNKVVSNWRPISLLPCLSKVFERLIASRIRTFCCANDIIPAHQFGFQNELSTCHPLAILHNRINAGLNSSRVTTTICLDIKAAFDTVWHQGLVQT